MYDIDPRRTDLAAEFKANPFGPHSPELQLVLNRMRRGSFRGRCVLVASGASQYTLAELSGVRGEAPKLLPEYVFDDPGEAEWAVFKLRWKKLTGQELELE